MKKKNILICLEQLNIGGVETAVLNQAMALKKNNNVFIIAKKGIYSKLLEQNGIKLYDFNFNIEDTFDDENIEKIKKIIKENKITSVYLHQLPCAAYLFPIIVELGLDYNVFLHSTVSGSYEWYMKTYKLYKYLLPVYFENANKIIGISKKCIDEHKKIFNLEDEKYILLKNSINLDMYNSKRSVKQLNKFVLISRFSEEKLTSIYGAIDFFREVQEKSNNEKQLIVIGDGDKLNEVKDYCIDISNVTFAGKTTNVANYIDKNDVVLGVDRCILESICMKKVSIICGYNGTINVVSKSNINSAYNNNFSGNNFKSNNITAEKLLMNSKKYIDEIIYNYNYIEENANIEKNIKCVENIKPKSIDAKSKKYIYNNLNIIDEVTKDLEKLKQENKKMYTTMCEQNIKIEELTTINELLNKKLSVRIINKLKRMCR